MLFGAYMVPGGFPGGSDGKEFACNAEDLGLLPGLGRSPGEEIGYPFQYSWASLVTQTVKNPPAMQENSVRFLGGESPLGKGMATHSSILPWRIPMNRGAWWAPVHGGRLSTEQHSTWFLATTITSNKSSLAGRLAPL